MDGLAVVGMIIVASTVILAIVCLILYAVIQKKRHYKCGHCHARFKENAFRSFLAAAQGANKRLHCPRCGAFDYMEFMRDDEDPEPHEDIIPLEELEAKDGE